MAFIARIEKIGGKINKEISRFLKRRLRDMIDYDAEFGQYITLLQLKEKLPPIPPKALQMRVAGGYYPEFFKHGRDMLFDLESILKQQGLSIFNFDNILDFGCGCGRLLIPAGLLMPPAKLSATDIDEQAIQWLKENYTSYKDIGANGFTPPMKYADGAFDFVYSISVFTHLPEDMQHAWLKELSRIIRPGGHGIFSIQGENFFNHLVNESSRSELKTKGFFYGKGGIADGLPEFYQNALHTHDYVKREWNRYFEVVAIYTKGIANHQDAVLVKRRAV